MVSRYEFLAALHALLIPRGYLEVGVYAGGSLNLASCPAIGVDPAPMVAAQGRQRIYSTTSDIFFANGIPEDFPPIDLGFIDGMHQFEFALRDFRNIEKFGHRKTIITFDDVLPYNKAIADRNPLPGDWTGDIWKMVPILEKRGNVELRLVDVSPTGVLLVKGLDPTDRFLWDNYEELVAEWIDKDVPDWAVDRSTSYTPESVLEWLTQ
jgi:hypothetical protein